MVALIIDETIKVSRPLSVSKKYNFVTSSMITSQLWSMVHTSIIKILEIGFSEIATHAASYATYRDSLNNLAELICLTHVEDVARSACSNGKIYYADTYKMGRSYMEFDGERLQKKVVEGASTLPVEKISGKIKELFTNSREPQEWFWETAKPQMISKPTLMCLSGTIMKVIAYFLSLKD